MTGLIPEGWPAAPKVYGRAKHSGGEGLALIVLTKHAGNLIQHPLNADPPWSESRVYIRQGALCKAWYTQYIRQEHFLP